MATLRILPNELFVKILEFLDFRSLCRCRQTCHLLQALVENTTALKYTIDLAISGQDDGLTSALGTAERYALLKKYQAAWDNVTWKDERRLRMFHGGLWELYGGVLAQNNSSGELVFYQLPSSIRGIEEKEWSHKHSKFLFHVRDFGMDPSSDLLVLIQAPQWVGANADHTHRIHLRSLSTAGQHPSARTPVLTHIQDERDAGYSYTIQISGDYVGILFNTMLTGENELLIWNWKKGILEIDVVGDEVNSYAFLSERYVVICLIAMSDTYECVEPSLFVLDFLAETPERQGFSDLEHVVFFRYPPLQSTVEIVEFDIRSDPAPEWKPHPDFRVPFHINDSARVYVLSLWVQGQGQELECIVHFVPRSTFYSKVNHIDSETPSISWEDWGPSGSRLLVPSRAHSSAWVCYVYGSRYITSCENNQDDPSAGSQSLVRVYDFNQLAIKHFVGRGSYSKDMQDVTKGDADCRTEYITTDSIFERDDIFEEEVRTSLPYRVRSFPLNVASLRQAVMLLSEDNIIAVDTRSEADVFRIQTI
ncbi:hypothetical protein BDQ12DRAFT_633178 [Crucibulum laeve]|uniref:F-box domain-containing protein n=1 Tax=Crucibulum laeve TaxID=68775 RepID=A0A5C3LVM1_9AGAR|nr:hypothetical protein BDQ12DRAFT_633178 [Crucibulum laeve]